MVLPQIQVIFTEPLIVLLFSLRLLVLIVSLLIVVLYPCCYSCLFCTNGVYIIINLFTALFQCPFLFYKLSNVRVL